MALTLKAFLAPMEPSSCFIPVHLENSVSGTCTVNDCHQFLQLALTSTISGLFQLVKQLLVVWIIGSSVISSEAEDAEDQRDSSTVQLVALVALQVAGRILFVNVKS